MGISGECGDDEQKHECGDELKEECFSSANLCYGDNARVHRMIDALLPLTVKEAVMEPRICAHLGTHSRAEVLRLKIIFLQTIFFFFGMGTTIQHSIYQKATINILLLFKHISGRMALNH